jgi:hypothetical protein
VSRSSVLALSVLLSSCGSAGSPDDADPDTGLAETEPDAGAATAATFTAIYDSLFPDRTNARCNFCHAQPANTVSNGKLHMGTDRATAYAALVGQSSVSEDCGGRMLVVPGDPDHSLFLDKMLPSASCGSRMPLGGMKLSDGQLQMVRSWIAAGAHDD